MQRRHSLSNGNWHIDLHLNRLIVGFEPKPIPSLLSVMVAVRTAKRATRFCRKIYIKLTLNVCYLRKTYSLTFRDYSLVNIMTWYGFVLNSSLSLPCYTSLFSALYIFPPFFFLACLSPLCYSSLQLTSLLMRNSDISWSINCFVSVQKLNSFVETDWKKKQK